MVKRRKKTAGRRLTDVIQRWFNKGVYICRNVGIACWTAAMRRCRRGPTVIVDARRRQAQRLRRNIARVARTYARALGAQLPDSLLIVVQRIVYEDRQLNSLLQAFETLGGGSQRYVIHLALSVNGHPVSDDELASAMRHQLTRVLKDSIGKPVLNVHLDLEVPRGRATTAIVELRPDIGDRGDGHERSSIPIQRIEHNQAS